MDKAGDLNRRITLQSPSQVQDCYGQPTQDWTDMLTTWAAIRAATSKEVYAASSFVSQVSHIVTIRCRPGIAAKQRILYRDRVFEIQAVSDPDEGRVILNCFV